MKKSLFMCLLIGLISGPTFAQKAHHTFGFDDRKFVLDGRPFQMISGELHPARIPAEYWQHRIRMAKAMGCNTISAYIFWNYHEVEEGRFDFTTWNRDLARFAALVQQEGMWLILRPGPYVCAEWDFGGLPSYLLKTPDIKVRCMDPRYMAAAERYIAALAGVIKPLQVTHGGPLLMLQIENEYGSYGNDRNYLFALEKAWRGQSIEVPFFTGDGPTPYMLEAGSLPGCAVGLDSGYDQGSFDLAFSMNPGVPVFSSETYPGWLTHWGEQWARPDTAALLKEVRFLMETGKSFNFYVIHGGTNFAYTAGANSGGKGYEPDVTSYDYDAPINEQGNATPKYHALRKLIGSYLPPGEKLPDIPEPIPAMSLPDIPMAAFTDIWSNLPEARRLVQPVPFEMLDQNQGLVLYRTILTGHKSGKLKVTELHDYATVFLNGMYIGTLNRREGTNTLELPSGNGAYPVLDILVEGMGHINFAQEIIDRKGITDRVTLNGMTLMNWEAFTLPLTATTTAQLKRNEASLERPGVFFSGSFNLSRVADTYLDLSGYTKGMVWVNGYCLGRYWNIGPQQSLYCPAGFMKEGVNEILVFDLHQTVAEKIRGMKAPE